MSMTPRLHLALFATTAFVTIFGVVEFAGWVLRGWRGNDWWGIDLHLIVDAGGRWLSGEAIYEDPAFLYPPLAALLSVPLTKVSFDLLSVGYAFLKVGVAVAAVIWLTPGWLVAARVMAVAALVFSLPFLHDVMLGNANVLLVGAMAVALFGSDRPRSGVLLGVAAALFAKPLVVPILLWLLVWRRPVLIGTVLAGLSATAVGVLIAGVPAYADWIGALLGGTRFASQFAGNHGVTAIVPGLWLPIAAITSVGLVVVLLRRGSTTGITWAATAGLLIAPYAGTYSALPLALAMPGIARVAPPMALLIVGVAPIATGHLLPVYAGLILVWSLLSGDRAAD